MAGGPVGNPPWATGSWSDTCWQANTWGAASGDITGTFAITEAADSFTASGELEGLITGTFDIAEAQDAGADPIYLLDANGEKIPLAGGGGYVTLAAKAVATGTVHWTAVLTATETADSAAFTGTVELQTISGTLATTEASDIAAFTGTIQLGAITGTLAATENPDILLFSEPPLHSEYVLLQGTIGNQLTARGKLGNEMISIQAQFVGEVIRKQGELIEEVDIQTQIRIPQSIEVEGGSDFI